ncbi:DUF5615 family PIN-like protein [Nocardia sp. NPDC050793]|uniref:DUF5615 family PIN-like protein n=1 Tax=Nocardia sp. NPDC050793 TaxID=3155159 RepID=UPI0033EF9D26
MKFLVDAQLPPTLARAMASEGHDAVHVCDLDMTAADDRGRGEGHRGSLIACLRG